MRFKKQTWVENNTYLGWASINFTNRNPNKDIYQYFIDDDCLTLELQKVEPLKLIYTKSQNGYTTAVGEINSVEQLQNLWRWISGWDDWDFENNCPPGGFED